MRKSLFVLLSILFVSLVSGCCGGSKDDSKQERVEYENTDFNYSIVLPAGFGTSTVDSIENVRGGKLFTKEGCQIDVTAMKMEPITSAELLVKESMRVQKDVYEDGEAKMIDSLSFIVKGTDDFGLHANYESQQKGNKYRIDMTYPPNKKEQFEKDVDEVIKSFKVK
ncbi:MAG: hypothetical protein IKW83_03670 [Muribaculaceae bacterium]|nr:hypothetical protein [Muribaculaceae bacterium]